MNLAEWTESKMASSATGLVRKEGKAEGSPCPSGMTGLGSSLLRLFISRPRTPRTEVADDVVYTSLALNFHLCWPDPFSIISPTSCVPAWQPVGGTATEGHGEGVRVTRLRIFSADNAGTVQVQCSLAQISGWCGCCSIHRVKEQAITRNNNNNNNSNNPR